MVANMRKTAATRTRLVLWALMLPGLLPMDVHSDCARLSPCSIPSVNAVYFAFDPNDGTYNFCS